MKRKILSVSTFAAIGGVALFQTPAHADSIEVKSGDSLWSLSKTYKTTVAELKKANNLKSDTIYKGQKLKIQNFKETSSVQSLSKPTISDTQPQAHTYTVQSGDTLWKVSQKFNMAVTEIKSLNLLRSDKIYVGQTLKLTGQAAEQNTTQESPVQKQPDVSSVNNPTSIDNEAGSDTYTVQSGDTVWKIAQEFNMTTTELKNLNLLRSDTIYVNQTLKIKGTSSTSINKEEKEPNIVSDPPSEKMSINTTQLLFDAKAVMGTPYKWGGTTPSGFDCSGFIYYVLNKQTPSKRLSTADYWSRSTAVSEPAVGDFVFFTTYSSGPSHMGIYVGDRQFIHAGSSTGVTISSMDSSYWKDRYLGAKRLQ
ncbi:C40 family peptidase [Priestia abyssalis]|uniref:C40 family peptidase n=1 Tax=Priestia abyssalis TaxID=1221450 RepID=UPI000994940E|nr:peptidoglycan endopeptidase [Priestia abyssalis]